MKTGPIAILSLIAAAVVIGLASCAGKPGVQEGTPEWVLVPPEDSADFRVFRGRGDSDLMSSARSAALDDLRRAVLEAMDLGDPENWSVEGKQEIDALFDNLGRLVKGSEGAGVEGVEVLRAEGWKNEDLSVSFVVDISWTRDVFDALAERLSSLVNVTSEEFSALESRARTAEAEGSTYEAALLWAAAAGAAGRNGNMSNYRMALREVERVLDSLDYSLAGVPSEAYVGTRPTSPVLFSVSSLGRPLSSGEFVVRYPRNSRDGTPDLDGGEARVLSGTDGTVRFLPPEVPYAGTQTVSIAPSADPFLEYLSGESDAYTDRFITAVETVRASGQYEAFPRTRTLPTGIVILETDLTGKPLNTSDAARGVLDDLLADGFDVGILNLDPAQMALRNDLEFLRDLKADAAVTGRYRRIIHGKVSLESFEQNGDSYTVRVSGSLILSDIDRQVFLYRSEISKTSRAAGSQQAISAAFRQLGRSFAGELIEELP